MNQITFALRLIHHHRHKLTRQQVKTLCGQAKAGDPHGALKGLAALVERGREKDG